MRKLKYLLFAWTLIIMSCSDVEEAYIANSESNEFLELTQTETENLNSLGLNLNDIQATKDAYIYQGDIVISKKSVEAALSSKDNNDKARIQRLGSNLGVISSNNYSIRYFISPSFSEPIPSFCNACPDISQPKCTELIPVENYERTQIERNLIMQAIGMWNNISGSGISFTETSNINSADLIFARTTEPIVQNNTNWPRHLIGGCGFALTPENGNPGRLIGINIQCLLGRLNNDEYRSLIAHEIGHTLGFYHYDDANPDPRQNLAACSSSYGNCSNRMMGASCCGIKRVISGDEQNVLKRMYPTFQNIRISRHGIRPQTSNTRVVDFYMGYSSVKPYEVIVHRFNPWNAYTPVHSQVVSNCPSSRVSYTSPVGTWKFKVEYVNYMGDRSNKTYSYTVNVQ